MKFNALLVGGRCDGKMAGVRANKFTIGMQICHDGEYYTVQDGPAAQYSETNQCGHDNLAVRAIFEGTQPAAPLEKNAT